jgi:tetratricopeptide (TPR) repeat protein
MDPAEIQQKLKEGIRAVRGGERERGRALLLQVVEADERIEAAWLWLSAAVDDPADKLVALENALTLNPNNAPAQAQLSELRRRLGAADAAPVADAPRTAAPAPGRASPPASPTPIPGTAVDLDDDPLQCAYCGKLTHESDDTCPHCGRNLLTWGKWKGGLYQYLALLLCGLNLQASFLQGAGPVVAVALAQGMDPSLVEMVMDFGGAALMGDILGGYGGWEAVALGAALFRTALWLGLTILFYNDLESAYGIAIGVGLVDAVWNLLSRFWLGFPGPMGAVINWGLAAMIVSASVPAILGRSQARVRMRVQPDPDALSGPELYRRGRKYQQQGKWALAALHWRKAMVMMPNEPLFFKALGTAQMQLGRYAKAHATLEEGASRAPHDPEFKPLVEMAWAKASTEGATDQRMKRTDA